MILQFLFVSSIYGIWLWSIWWIMHNKIPWSYFSICDFTQSRKNDWDSPLLGETRSKITVGLCLHSAVDAIITLWFKQGNPREARHLGVEHSGWSFLYQLQKAHLSEINSLKLRHRNQEETGKRYTVHVLTQFYERLWATLLQLHLCLHLAILSSVVAYIIGILLPRTW